MSGVCMQRKTVVTAKCFKIYNFMTLAVPGLARMFACLFVLVWGAGGGGNGLMCMNVSG